MKGAQANFTADIWALGKWRNADVLNVLICTYTAFHFNVMLLCTSPLPGITAIEVAEGAPPHSQLQGFRVLRAILHSEPPTLQLKFWSDTFRDFIKRCLVKVPEQRPTALELMSHPFITSAPNMTVCTYVIARSNRCSCCSKIDEFFSVCF